MQKNNSTYNISKKLRHCSYVFFSLLFVIIISGCSTSKYLQEGQSFYTGSEIKFIPQGKVNGKSTLKKDLETYITPKPNTKIFGARPGVWFYYKAGTPKKKKGGLKNFIKNKLGQPPVLLSDVSPDRTAKMLSGKTNNEGFFGSTVSSVVKTNEKKKESKVIYTIKIYPAYHLRNINFPKGRDSTYAHIMRTLYEKSLLKPKQRYQLERLF
jgi:outer membrane protein insertion porin family